MATHEREITEPVELCLPDGARLNPDARGYARSPLMTANLQGSWGRTKRWDYWAVLAEDLVVSITYADVDYLGIADVWWCDLRTGASGGRAANVAFARGIKLPDTPGSAPLRYRSAELDLELIDDSEGTTMRARWTDRAGESASLDLRVDLPAGHESLNVVIPWSERRFQYTSKHQARPARGVLTVGDQEWRVGTAAKSDRDEPRGPGEGTEAWGVLDVGRGRWPYSTRWNWGGGAGRSVDGAVVGLQLGAKWTEGTGFTENGVIIDGRLTKIGEELTWTYDWDHPRRPWRVRHRDGSVDLTLETTYDRHSKVQAGLLATEVHQVFGQWTGHVTDEEGRTHRFAGILGFAEESRSRW